MQSDLFRCDAQQAFDQPGTVLRLIEVAEYRNELVASHARYGIALAQGGFHALAYGDQHGIAGVVTVTIVDRLDVVQIEEDYRQRLAVAVTVDDGLFQPVGQQQTIGQAGQWVEVGDALEELLGDFTCTTP